MLKIKILTLLLGIKTLFCGCGTDTPPERVEATYKLSRIGTLSQEIDESSGLMYVEADSSLITHNDGNSQQLYITQKDGQLKAIKEFRMELGDFEDLAYNREDSILYIGDVGDNANQRPMVFIHHYKWPSMKYMGTTTVRYQDRNTTKVLLKKDMNFDCEAIFYHNHQLYLVSKNRGSKSVKLYKVPADTGHHVGVILDRIKLAAQVTGADINPECSEFALLTYGYVYTFGVGDGKIDFGRPRVCRKIVKGGQMEGICYANNTDLIVSNEGGKLFYLKRSGR